MTRHWLALAAAAVFATTAPAADKAFTVTWYGQSFFTVATPSGKVIAFDPQGMDQFPRDTDKAKVKADLVCVSHLHSDHNQVDGVIADGADPKKVTVFQGLVQDAKMARPAEWAKIDQKLKAGDGEFRVRTIGTYHDGMGGLKRGKNAAFVVEADGLTFAHLGDLGHELTEQEAKAFGKVDVLFVPVGGIYTINGEEAKKVVEAIKPRLYVIPMHYGVEGYMDLQPPDEFLDGQKAVKKLEGTNELVIPADAKPGDAPTVALFHWRKAEPKKDK